MYIEYKLLLKYYYIEYTNMTKVGTFGGINTKVGTFTVTICWDLYYWSLYRARVLRAQAGP